MKVHRNYWPWGECVTFILYGGAAIFRLSFTKEQPNIAYLSDVSVVERERRKGYGRKMLNKAIENARKRKCESVRLIAYPGDFVVDWYKRNGFVESGAMFIDGGIELEKKL